MRSRYLPDGSVDYEADRMLEILRHADTELERQQREQAQAISAWQDGGPRPKRRKVTTPQDAMNAEWQEEHLPNPEAFFEGIFNHGDDLAALQQQMDSLFSSHPSNQP